MKPIGTMDCETDPFKHGRVPKEFAWGIYLETKDGLIYKRFWGEDCTVNALDWLAQIKWKGIIYLHNGGKFDVFFFLKYFQQYATSYKISLIKSRIAKLKFYDIEFRDSFLILPVALKQTGDKQDIEYWKFWDDVKELSREKRENADSEYDTYMADLSYELYHLQECGILSEEMTFTDFYRENLSPRKFYKKQILDYLKQDCVGLYENVRSFIDRFGLGLTLANRSFSEMKKDGIEIHHSHRYQDEVYRPFFFGGRCQAFETGYIEGNLTYVDLNSAYPYAMLHDHFWSNSSDVYHTLEGLHLKAVQTSLIELECISLGAFPVRTRDGIFYPEVGKAFNITGWEYLAAKDKGLIQDENIISVRVPHSVGNFKPFIKRFYREKLEAEKSGDTQKRLFAKLMMNSGFGRFAMNPDSWKHYAMTEIYSGPPIVAEEENNQNEWEIINRLEFAGLDIYCRDITQGEERFYNVATAASITGFVRAMMMRAIENVERILYVDTDSMILDGGYEVPISSQLGDWSLEARGCRAWIAGKKLYCFEREDGSFINVSKGVKLDENQIQKISLGEKVKWRSEAPSFSLKSKTRFVERTVKKTA